MEIANAEGEALRTLLCAISCCHPASTSCSPQPLSVKCCPVFRLPGANKQLWVLQADLARHVMASLAISWAGG